MIQVTDQLNLNLPLPIDTRHSNKVLLGSVLKIETINEYLDRVDFNNRELNSIVNIYSPPGNYDINLFQSQLNLGAITCLTYTFAGGTHNSNFIKYVKDVKDDGIVVVDNLNSTNPSDSLSANMGRELNSLKVNKVGNETIADIKTFSSSPIVPTPVTDMQVSTKKYVDDTKGSIQSKQIIAGAGLTGGGDLSADRTINVVSANDGITANADNIQLNTIDNVTTTSVTKPLSANQGKVLDEKITQVGADLNKIPDNLEPALAEILNQQNKRIEALESLIKNMLFKAGQFDTIDVVKQLNLYGGTNLIIIGTAAPSVVPDFVGQCYINTTGGVIYQAKGISATSDWKQTSN